MRIRPGRPALPPPILRSVAVAGLALVCTLSGFVIGQRSAPAGFAVAPDVPSTVAAEDRRAFGVVWEALAQIERDYYGRQTLDRQKLAEGAARGLVEAVGDPYTRLSQAETADAEQTALRGSLDGIGVQLDTREAQPRVIAALDGSPAQRAGVLPRDVIVAVDGTPTLGLGSNQILDRIRGPRGSSITLSLMRAGHASDVQMVRERITLSSVQARVLPGDVPLGYMRISIFAEPTAQQAAEGLANLAQAGVYGLVLDLRSDPGGYLNSAVDVASLFVRDAVVLYQQPGSGADQPRAIRTTGSPLAPDLPMVVLIDGGSASAAEILAAALRDNGRAALIGEKSFGKGSVQSVHTLSDDSQLRVTVAHWLTPKQMPIQGLGLEPDLHVEATADGDAVLEAATDYLRTGRRG